MVKLFCAIVGEARSAFPVDIDAGQTVGDLKDAVKTKINYLGPAYELQLFLAKTTNGAWLDGAGAAAVALNECGHPQGTITKLVEMDPLLWLKNTKYFGKNFQPGEGQVHVLVVVPSDPTIEKLKSAWHPLSRPVFLRFYL
ncbi:hypothetical protein PI125_g12569 [Phytophthora idaei]|nr:hypothetical protein PI125_g12569 [Phytophthora idaei]KAG3150458.1 hypothetical protein PI126_g11512 [Phytophthora idaei]